MRAEDAAVGVALVDDHKAQPAQERGPLGVPGQDRPVQHVGVGEHEPGVRPDPVPFGLRACRRRSRWGGRRAGRRARRRSAAGRRRAPWSATGRARWPAGRRAARDKRRQLVGQRLAGRGAGGDHHVFARRAPARPPRPGAARARRCPARRGRSAASPATQAGHGDGLAGRGRHPLDVQQRTCPRARAGAVAAARPGPESACGHTVHSGTVAACTRRARAAGNGKMPEIGRR